jgi:hypothetical protein
MESSMKQFCLAIVPFICLGGTTLAQTDGKAPAERRPTKELLNADSFSKLHTLIQPETGEYRWDEIHWLASIWHARKKAAAEDKPIFIFGTAGAGFNDPLGNC